MNRRSHRTDPVLTERAMDRLRYLGGESPPRRARGEPSDGGVGPRPAPSRGADRAPARPDAEEDLGWFAEGHGEDDDGSLPTPRAPMSDATSRPGRPLSALRSLARGHEQDPGESAGADPLVADRDGARDRDGESGRYAAPEPGPLAALPPAHRFTRVHLAVVACLAVLALLWAGWSVLRARPVALATPVTPSAVSPPPANRPVGSTRPPGAGASAGSSPSTAASPAAILVHVLGAVKRPGVVSLTERARVRDAIAAAGGLRDGADPGELNLAQVLTDGQQIVIGTHGSPSGTVRDGAGSPAAESATSPGGPAGGTVDLNSASQAELEELPGVGPVTAGKILAWRTEHGRFSAVAELQEVAGIGPKTYAEIAPHVRV